jgi:hypothetical protein
MPRDRKWNGLLLRLKWDSKRLLRYGSRILNRFRHDVRPLNPDTGAAMDAYVHPSDFDARV